MPRQPKPGGFSFVPRNLSTAPSRFGKQQEPLIPISGIQPDGPRFRAAQMQHQIAVAIRTERANRGETVQDHAPEFPDAEARSVDRVQRVLRGESMMTFADVTYWASVSPRLAEVIVEVFAGAVSPPSAEE